MDTKTIAYTFASFGIVIGAVELSATKTFGRSTGLAGQETLIRTMGMREVVSGVALFSTDSPAPWLAVRAAGDLYDAGIFATAMSALANRKRGAARVMFWASLAGFALDAGFAWYVRGSAKGK